MARFALVSRLHSERLAAKSHGYAPISIYAQDTGKPEDGEFKPNGLNDKDGAFLLHHGDMVRLVRYIWHGSLLPAERGEYCTRMGTNTQDVNTRMWGYIDPIIAAYNDIKTHTTDFRLNVYEKDLIKLANDVINYAQKSGGTVDDSYYVNFMLDAEDYANEMAKDNPDQDTLDDLADDMGQFSGSLGDDIDKMLTRCDTLVKQLGDFKGQCANDELALSPALSNLNTALTDNNGDIANLKEKLKDDQDELNDDQAAYDYDMWKVHQAAYYCWVWPIGSITALVMDLVYKDKARKMKKYMSDIRDRMQSEQRELDADLRLVADINHMQAGGKNLLDQIEPAITVINTLMTCWRGIQGDIQRVADAAKDRSLRGGGKGRFGKVSQKEVLNAWNRLLTDATAYRNNAYISSVEIKSLQEVIAEAEQLDDGQ